MAQPEYTHRCPATVAALVRQTNGVIHRTGIELALAWQSKVHQCLTRR